MPVQTVKAEVIDLQADQPDDRDEFAVDTNSWTDLTYSRIRQPKVAYQTYIKRALEAKAALYTTGSVLLELASIIERNEWELYSRTGGALQFKDFRHEETTARASTLEEISSAWGQVRQFAQLMEMHLDKNASDRFLSAMKKSCIDAYDAPLLDAMSRRGVINIITDDGDFANVADIRVFTANKHVLSVARRQDRLRSRS
jgi:predicted nucleic acid-binding protein